MLPREVNFSELLTKVDKDLLQAHRVADQGFDFRMIGDRQGDALGR